VENYSACHTAITCMRLFADRPPCSISRWKPAVKAAALAGQRVRVTL
jgi:hypothetical protein